nr:obscurin-like [Penaeus vannamei]
MTGTFETDQKYSLERHENNRSQKWKLVIRDVQLADQGQYRCQVSTQIPMVISVTLNVTEPRARVVDERGTKVHEKHYNSGSMIELKCEIESVPFPPAAVSWRRGATLLSFNTSRGGISVKGDAASGYIRSRLYVADASPADSGLYSCWYGNYTSDTVSVHVIAEFQKCRKRLFRNAPEPHFPNDTKLVRPTFRGAESGGCMPMYDAYLTPHLFAKEI